MTTTVYEQTSLAEREIAGVVARAYVAYVKTLDTLPTFFDDAAPDKQRYLNVVHRLGAAFAPTLARASQLFDEASGIESELGASYPETLPHLVRILEDIFVLFWSVTSTMDLSELATALPTTKAVRDAFDPAISVWVRERGAGITAV
jgi:hypothetical protein